MKPHVVNVRAAIFRWVLRDPATFVELDHYRKPEVAEPEIKDHLSSDSVSNAVCSGERAMSAEEIVRIANELARMKKAGALEGLGKDELRNIATTIHLFGASDENAVQLPE